MSTCRQVITSALRKLNVVSEGQAAPAAYHAMAALDVLQSSYLEFVSRGLFCRLDEIEATAALEAEEWQRIRTHGFTITLPTTIVDSCSGEDRAPKDLALIALAQAVPEHHLYEAQTGAWVQLDGLTLDSYAPLSHRDPDGLACYLAGKLYEDGYGAEPGALTISQARRFHGALAVRYDSAAVVGEATYF